jgi:hypothetical protein
MKKNYLLSLDQERVEELKRWLEPKGQTFSGYVNLLVSEQLDTVKKFNIPADVSELTLAKFAAMFQKMAVSLAREARKKK